MPWESNTNIVVEEHISSGNVNSDNIVVEVQSTFPQTVKQIEVM